MSTPQDVAVTYTGTDEPFKDRIYRSGLTFMPGQTRDLPSPLAARFLQHEDVFKPAVVVKAAAPQTTVAVPVATPTTPTEPTEPTAPTAPPEPTQTATEPVLDAQQQDQGSQAQKPDDTQALLDAARQQEEDQRTRDSARFELLDSIEGMDRAALIAWADQHYRQKIPANVSVAKARDMARGMLDQYGMPA